VSDKQWQEPDDFAPDEDPVLELRDFQAPIDPQLVGRVNREIQRRDLLANGLELSFSVFLSTCWEHLKLALETWPGAVSEEKSPNPEPKEDPHG
jgi:hypothetical protein